MLERAFEALAGGAGNFALLPCNANGHPGGLIVTYRLTASGVEIAPLFVSLTPGMTITGKDGDSLYGQAAPG